MSADFTPGDPAFDDDVRIYKGPRLTPLQIAKVYAPRPEGAVGPPTLISGKLVWPHAHQCPDCLYMWYCEEKHRMDPYLPAMYTEGDATDPEHDCNEHPGSPKDWKPRKKQDD